MTKTLTNLVTEKKARRPRLLDVGDLTSYTNYLLIVTATSERHARALADYIVEELKKQQVQPLGMEGHAVGQWILLDYGEIIVHIFQEDAREYYNLDGLWIDAENLSKEEVG